MLGEEAEPPYERPPLSKGYLLGRTGADELPVLPRGWYAEHDVQLRLSSTVTAVDTGARTVYLTGGEPVRYDAALVATGGRPRRLPGIDGQRVLVLRTRRDADRLAGHLRRGEDLAILGGGFIGCEVAAAARTAGAEVTLLELQDTLLESVLGAQFGELVAGLHRRAGVRLRTGSGYSRSSRARTRCWCAPTGECCAAACCWWRSGWCRTWSCWPAAAWRAGTACWWTRTAGPARTACSRPATWPGTSTRCTVHRCGSSTTRTPSGRGPPRPRRCSARVSRTPTRTVLVGPVRAHPAVGGGHPAVRRDGAARNP